MEEKPEQMEVFEIETAQPKRESKKKTDKKIILFLVVLSIMWSFVIYLLVKIIMNISYINKEKIALRNRNDQRRKTFISSALPEF